MISFSLTQSNQVHHIEWNETTWCDTEFSMCTLGVCACILFWLFVKQWSTCVCLFHSFAHSIQYKQNCWSEMNIERIHNWYVVVYFIARIRLRVQSSIHIWIVYTCVYSTVFSANSSNVQRKVSKIHANKIQNRTTQRTNAIGNNVKWKKNQIGTQLSELWVLYDLFMLKFYQFVGL